LITTNPMKVVFDRFSFENNYLNMSEYLYGFVSDVSIKGM